jgi:gluconolactonase
MNPALTLLSPAASGRINPAFTIEKLDDGCAFSEGPVWHPDGFYLYSDIPANAIFRIEPGGKKDVWLERSGCTHEDRGPLSEQTGSNGLAWGPDGALYICQHGNGAVGQWKHGRLQQFLDGVGGRPFNSPNDIVVHGDGTVFFSDPPYGLKNAALNASIRQERAAFYAWRNGVLTAFCTDYQYPNGLCLSPDGETIYLCSNKPFERFVTAYRTSTLERIGIAAEENSDGIKCDRAGNLYLCTKEGIVVLSPAGERLARIALETIPANCCWGGQGGNDLFVTARENLFLLRGFQ